MAKGLKKILGEFEGTRAGRFVSDLVGQQFYERFRKLTPDQIQPELIRHLLSDLRTAPCPEALPDVQRPHRPWAVLFLDTFEKLRQGAGGAAQGSQRERWVRDLHDPDGRLLIVTAGRDRNRWDEEGDQKEEYSRTCHLEQHLVGGLSRSDAIDFLTKCKVEGAPLQEAILRVSLDVESEPEDGEHGYHPFSLALCADTVVSAIANGKAVSADDFDMSPGDIGKLAQRFLLSLASTGHELWIGELAVPPRFDEVAARHFYSEHRSVEQDAAWWTLLRYSFVRPVDDRPGWYEFHTKMRDALIGIATGSGAQHARWRSHWQGRSQSDCDDFAGLAWFHRYCLEPDGANLEWNYQCETKLQSLDTLSHYSMLSWWGPTGIFEKRYPTPQEGGFLNDIGVELSNTTIGCRADTIRDAINCYTAALTVRTEATFPHDWAYTQCNLGVAYANLPDGDYASNLRMAIGCSTAALRVLTQRDYPRDWARTQNIIGASYKNLPDGNQIDNCRVSIQCFTAALSVTTREDFPIDWAMTQNNLGNAHYRLPDGDRVMNLRAAIDCYTAAHTIYTKEAFPQHWATTQNNLGNAHSDLPDEDWAANLGTAITCYTAALTVRTEKAFPQQWADTQLNLAFAHEMFADREDRDVHLRQAESCLISSEIGYRLAQIEKDVLLVRQALERVRAKLVSGETT